MNTAQFFGKVICAIAILIVFACGGVSATGLWLTGKVTQSPWHQQGYQYIQINNVRYTIMSGAKCQFVYKVDGATQKISQDIASLHAGETLAVMVEGNRIYQIEKTR